jgi:hypothetical protein
MNKGIKLYDTDYVWFDGKNIDMGAIYAEESLQELFEDGFLPLQKGEKFIKMTDLPISVQGEFIELIKTNKL